MALVDRESGELSLPGEQGPASMKEQKKSGFSWTMIKNTLIGIVIVGALGFVGWSFYQDTQTAIIENPTVNDVQVQIDDGEAIDLISGNWVEVKLAPGKHVLKVDGESLGAFTKDRFDRRPMINPTKSEFIMEYTYYSDDDYSSQLPSNTVTFYGEELEGPFEVFSDIYIPKKWDYYLSEAFPDEISMSRGSSYEIKTKLFSYFEFLQTYYPEALESLKQQINTGAIDEVAQ